MQLNSVLWFNDLKTNNCYYLFLDFRYSLKSQFLQCLNVKPSSIPMYFLKFDILIFHSEFREHYKMLFVNISSRQPLDLLNLAFYESLFSNIVSKHPTLIEC